MRKEVEDSHFIVIENRNICENERRLCSDIRSQKIVQESELLRLKQDIKYYNQLYMEEQK